TLQAGLFIATKRREIKMAVGVDKTANQARSSLLNVGSFACGASLTSATSVSLATGAGGITIDSGVTTGTRWRLSGAFSVNTLPTVDRK
ncbi:hypothetical protein AAIH56_35630, partial [Pseudomonas aeruginosa]|uniref:hypothetical protein n=1 Tax=Pseudomonas aeruginosa TaxID=287 RepID=UPI0031B759B6